MDFSSKPKVAADGADLAAMTDGKAYVPALRLEDGSVLTETPALLLYIAAKVRAVGR